MSDGRDTKFCDVCREKFDRPRSMPRSKWVVLTKCPICRTAVPVMAQQGPDIPLGEVQQKWLFEFRMRGACRGHGVREAHQETR
jgi:hypothetical protein